MLKTACGNIATLLATSHQAVQHAGGPFSLCENAISDFQKTQVPGWKTPLPMSKKLRAVLLALPVLFCSVYIPALWFFTPCSSPKPPLSPLERAVVFFGSFIAVVGLVLLWVNVEGTTEQQRFRLGDPLGPATCPVKDCPTFQRNRHPPVETEKPDEMKKLLDALGVPPPMLLAAGTGDVRKPRRSDMHGAVVSNLDKYWSTILVLALWSPEFQKHLCNDSNGLFRWRSVNGRGLLYGPISGARLMHCGIMPLGRAAIMPTDNFTKI